LNSPIKDKSNKNEINIKLEKLEKPNNNYNDSENQDNQEKNEINNFNYFKKGILKSKENAKKKNLIINTNNSVIKEQVINEDETSNQTIKTKSAVNVINVVLQKKSIMHKKSDSVSNMTNNTKIINNTNNAKIINNANTNYINKENIQNDNKFDLTRSKSINSVAVGLKGKHRNKTQSLSNLSNNTTNINNPIYINNENTNEKWKLLKVNDIISEQKLYCKNGKDIMMQGPLFKYTPHPNNKTHLYFQSYANKFFILSKNYFGYYRSKEDFLTIQNPLFEISNTNICSVNRFNFEKNNFDNKQNGKTHYYLSLDYYSILPYQNTSMNNNIEQKIEEDPYCNEDKKNYDV